MFVKKPLMRVEKNTYTGAKKKKRKKGLITRNRGSNLVRNIEIFSHYLILIFTPQPHKWKNKEVQCRMGK